MKSKWPTVIFSDAVEDVTGGNPKLANSDYLTSGLYPVIDQGQEFVSGYTDDSNLLCKQKGDLIVFGDHTKAFKFVDFDFVLGADGVKVLKAKEGFDPKFIYYCLRKFRFPENVGYSRHFKFLKECLVPKPPLEEQKCIAAILDKVDSLRRKRAQAIALADDFLRATFLDMFGDPATNPKGLIKVRLDSICDVGSSKRVFVEELKENGVPFYRGTEIGQLGDRRKVEPTLFIAEEHYARLKSEAGVPQKGDLLLPSICPDGRIYVVDTEEQFYFKDARVLWIKVNHSNIDSFYLQWFLKSMFPSEYSKIASGTTFAELKIFALKQLEVYLPPIDVQRHFAKVVNSTERLLKSYEKSREFHDQLSQSFQHDILG